MLHRYPRRQVRPAFEISSGVDPGVRFLTSTIRANRYLAKIVRVFPPQSVRDAAFAEQQAAIAAAASAASPAASTSANPDGARPPQRPVVAPLDYDAIAHRLGCDLNVDAKKARTEDNPEEYLYTLQLMDEQYRFEGSSMEVHARQLSYVPLCSFVLWAVYEIPRKTDQLVCA